MSSFNLLDRLADRRVRRRWRQVAERAAELPVEDLPGLRAEARDMRRTLDRLTHAVEGRLARQRIDGDRVPRPSGADCAWRPELWCGPVVPAGIARVEARTRLSPDVAVHHDCALNEVTFRQVPNMRQGDISPFGTAIDVLGFQGSYLSLTVDLPAAALVGLTRQHTFHFEMPTDHEGTISIRPRLNIKSGPNTDYVDSWVERSEKHLAGDFDLGFTKINERRVERAWVTLFLDTPAMSRVVIRDLVLSRRIRAEV